MKKILFTLTSVTLLLTACVKQNTPTNPIDERVDTIINNQSRIEPIYNDLAKSYKGVVSFYTMDVEAEKGVEAEYGIMELPTILFFWDGKIIDHAVGLTSRNILITKIENAIAANNN